MKEVENLEKVKNIFSITNCNMVVALIYLSKQFFITNTNFYKEHEEVQNIIDNTGKRYELNQSLEGTKTIEYYLQQINPEFNYNDYIVEQNSDEYKRYIYAPYGIQTIYGYLIYLKDNTIIEIKENIIPKLDNIKERLQNQK